MNKIIILLIIYYIYINTSLLFYANSTYELKNDLTLKKNDLLVCTHSYEYIDVFVIINEYIKKKQNVTIVFANKIHNHILKYYLYSIGVTWINFLFVKGGTVNKVKEIIKKEPVIIYLYKFLSHKTGIYYMSKNSKNIYLCKIRSNHPPKTHDKNNYLEVFIRNFGKHYEIEYLKYNYNLNDSPDVFMNKLKNSLYN